MTHGRHLIPTLPLLVRLSPGSPTSPAWTQGRIGAAQRASADPDRAAASTSIAVHPPLLLCSKRRTSMNRAFELRVIDLLNAERARHGLGPLAEEPCPALDRGRTSFRAHTGDDSALPLDHIAQKRGEQCQFGSGTEYPTPDDAIIGWMGIPPHRAILLQPEVTRIGFGVHPVAGDPHAYAIVRVPGHPPRAATPPAAVERVLMERIAARRRSRATAPLTALRSAHGIALTLSIAPTAHPPATSAALPTLSRARQPPGRRRKGMPERSIRTAIWLPRSPASSTTSTAGRRRRPLSASGRSLSKTRTLCGAPPRRCRDWTDRRGGAPSFRSFMVLVVLDDTP